MTFVFFILMIGGLIAIHEAGHMLVAKLFNIYVKEYAIGFGPKIWSHQGKETLYTLRLIPLGGFTGMVEEEGMDDSVIVVDDAEIDAYKENNPEETRFVLPRSRSFYGANAFKRIAVLVAGPLFNVLTAFVIFIGIFASNGATPVYPEAVISEVSEGMPAALAGVLPGDKIIEITYENGDKVKIETTYDMSLNNEMHKGGYTITVLRGEETLDFSLTPVYSEQYQQEMIGITFGGEITYKELSFGEAVVQGIGYTFDNVSLTIKSIGLMISGNVSADNISGTIGMYSYTQEALSYGFITYLALVGSISISLAVMNLIPVPVFDGGRVLITLIEIVLGRRINKKVETIIMYIGLALILLLFIFTTVNDITKLFK